MGGRVSAVVGIALRTRPTLRGTVAAVAFASLLPGVAAPQSMWDDPAFVLYRQGLDAMDAKDFAKAAALARDATSAYPEHVLAFSLLGQASLAQSRWEDAAQALAKVTALYPGAASAQRDLGAAYQQLGRIDEAARALEAALATRPEDDDTRVRLAIMLVNANQRARALPHLTALGEGNTKLPDVYLAMARAAYDTGDFAGSAVAFERAVALRDNGRTWFNLGVVRVRLGNTAGALEAFERAAQFPDTKEQATREIQKVKAGAGPPARSSRPGR
jgi:tetratricopeptide (TPR) repeat protein